MPAPTVTTQEASGLVALGTGVDYAMCVVGYSSAYPIAAGKMTSPYVNPGAAVSDLGQGDAVDCLCQAIKITQGNPAPSPACFYQTPPTTPGSYGTVTTSGVTGTTVVTANAAIVPTGTRQPWMQITNTFTVGVAGGTAFASLDGGLNRKPVSIGTADSYNFPPGDGWPAGGGQAGFVFGPPVANVSALYTGLNALRTAELAHFIIVSGSPQVHLAADTTDNTALTAVPVASSPATAVALYNALVSRIAAHGASLTYHTTADTVLATALAGIPVASNTEDVELNLAPLISAYNAHRILVGAGPVHGSADTTNTCAAFTTTPGTLNTGDVFFTNTIPPQWADADLYSAGPPATGALAAIANSGTQIGIVVITEPVAIADFATLSTGLDYFAEVGKQAPVLMIRFRDPMTTTGETDAQYIAAFQAFCAACHDNRIGTMAGSGLLTDAFSGFRYLRSGLAAVVAREQSFVAVAGAQGEKIAQSPGWVKRGPLEGFSLIDDNGNLVGHDESQRAGISPASGAATGTGLAFYYNRNAQVQGTYTTKWCVLYPVLSEILNMQDRRLANAIERTAVAMMWPEIQGADIWDPVTFVLDVDAAQALASKIHAQIQLLYGSEFQNAADPNIVTVGPNVTVVGDDVTIPGTVAVRFYGYTQNVLITFQASR